MWSASKSREDEKEQQLQAVAFGACLLCLVASSYVDLYKARFENRKQMLAAFCTVFQYAEKFTEVEKCYFSHTHWNVCMRKHTISPPLRTFYTSISSGCYSLNSFKITFFIFYNILLELLYSSNVQSVIFISEWITRQSLTSISERKENIFHKIDGWKSDWNWRKAHVYLAFHSRKPHVPISTSVPRTKIWITTFYYESCILNT